MDGKAFDDLAKTIGSGVTRRTILRGMAGLVGVSLGGAVAASDADARSRGRISNPPPPPTSTTTTPPPSDRCVGYSCGSDCCASSHQCCDGECCAPDATCLNRVFSEGPFVEEEVCCITEQTCDNRCCDGACFTPLGEAATGFDRSCCPAEATLCPAGTDTSFAGVGSCCSDPAPDCCLEDDGRPVCLTPDQCCTVADCQLPDACTEPQCLDHLCQAESTCFGEAPDCCGTGAQGCTNIDTDPEHCSACGVQCPDGFICVGGECQCDDPADCDPFDECTPAECVDGTCRADTRCIDDDICCGAGSAADCCTSAECIDDECCTGVGQSVCGEACCQGSLPDCCDNGADPGYCIPSGATCCAQDTDCAHLDACRDGNHETFTCAAGGFCSGSTQSCDDDNACTNDSCVDGVGCVNSPIDCTDSNPCTIDACDTLNGCIHENVAPGTLVEGGICCEGGTFRPGGNCCTFEDCPDLPCTSRSCPSGTCSMLNLCEAANPECQIASCDTGECVIETDCEGFPQVGINFQCTFGCQCPSNTLCTADAASDPTVCRGGGGGDIIASFCPT